MLPQNPSQAPYESPPILWSARKTHPYNRSRKKITWTIYIQATKLKSPKTSHIWNIFMVFRVPLLFKRVEGPITAKIGAVICGGLEGYWMNEQGWTGEHLRKWGHGSAWAFKGYLLVAFKLMLTLAVQLSWACARRSLRDEEKVPTLSFSDRSRRVHLSRCDTSLMNREDRKSGTLKPMWSSEK